MAIGPEVSIPLVGRVALIAGYNETDGKHHLCKVDDSGYLQTKDPTAIEHGYGTASAAVAAGASVNITITFSGNLTGVPSVVVASVQAVLTDVSKLHGWLRTYNQTTAVVRVRNDTADALTITAHAIALRAV